MPDPFVGIPSNELCLLWKGHQYHREKFFYLKESSIGCRKFECTPNHFWRLFSFLRNFSIGESFTSYNGHFRPSKVFQMNCAFFGMVSNVLEESFFTWNDLVLASKSPKEFTPSLFWQILSFLRNLAEVKLLLFMTGPYIRIGSNKLRFLWKGNLYRIAKLLYLKQCSIGKNFESVYL